MRRDRLVNQPVSAGWIAFETGGGSFVRASEIMHSSQHLLLPHPPQFRQCIQAHRDLTFRWPPSPLARHAYRERDIPPIGEHDPTKMDDACRNNGYLPHIGQHRAWRSKQRDWCFIAEQQAPATHLTRPVGHAALTYMDLLLCSVHSRHGKWPLRHMKRPFIHIKGPLGHIHGHLRHIKGPSRDGKGPARHIKGSARLR